MNVVDLGEKRKPADPCPYCGNKPACPDFTCPRIKSVWSGPDGEWEIQFHDPRDDAPEPAA
jgi:hypothetical protein